MNRPSVAAWRFLRRTGSSRPPCFSTTVNRPSAFSPPHGSLPLPLITEITGHGGWRVSDVLSKMMQHRIIWLSGPVHESMATYVQAQLVWLEHEDPDKTITMYINSPGGEIPAGLAIYDTMEHISAPVSTVVVGQAASMAAVLLLGGEPGLRYALPHSSVMLHQPIGGTSGQADDILIYANQIQRVREQVNRIVHRHINAPFGRAKFDLATIAEMTNRDNHMTAEAAKEHGIVDEILRKKKPQPQQPKPESQSQPAEKKAP